MDKNLAIMFLQNKLSPKLIVNYVISTEQHADGTDHLHIGLWLNSRVNTRDAHFVDLSFGEENFHGHYKAMKYPRECAIYVTKFLDWITSDPDWLTLLMKQKKKRTDVVATAIMSGDTIRSLTVDHAGLVMMNLQRIQAFQAWINTSNWIGLPLPPPKMNLSLVEAKIMRWIAINLLDATRVLRQPQLYLHGKTGTGKTSLVQCLEKTFKTFKPSYEVIWWDNFDDSFDLIVYDEFKGQVKSTMINKVLDGQSMIIPRRGGDFNKTKNTPVIICSNYAPSEIYHNTESVTSFLGRLNVVTFDCYFNIFQ